ncbi:MAG: hypothetical protein ABI297_09160 [Ginsengibacter sp.]
MKKILFASVIILFILSNADAQYKTYKISVKGDTINAVDLKGMKQGKWVLHVNPLRGEPGFEEEGFFVNDQKNGSWRKYDLQGDLIAYENFKKGDKDGKSEYYNAFGDLLRVENWRGYNPEQPYDTIPVYGTGNNEILNYKIIKAQPYSVKDGAWTYYEKGIIIKTENYDRGFLLNPTKTEVATDAPMKKIVPKEVIEYQKKNSNKKRVKVRDGSTGY